MFTFLNTDDLRDDTILLRLREAAPADPVKRHVPAYKFDICLLDGTKVGVCDLRVGHTMGLFFGGNIGYGIDEPYRGHHFAARACGLLFRLAARHDMQYVYITCNPANPASSRTCQLAGCVHVCTLPLPEDTDLYQRGERDVMVYRKEL